MAGGTWIKSPRGAFPPTECCECQPNVCDPCVECGVGPSPCITFTDEPTVYTETCGPADVAMFLASLPAAEGAAGTFKLYGSGAEGCSLQVILACNHTESRFADICGTVTCATPGCQDRSRSLTVGLVTITPDDASDFNNSNFCEENTCDGEQQCCFSGDITVALASGEVVDCSFSVGTGSDTDDIAVLIFRL